MSELLKIICGDAYEVLKTLPGESVNCCVTSPPYWGLRDYGVDGQIGLEKSPAEYVARLVQIFREVHRVLQDDGTLWLNLGDSYAGGGNYRGLNSENTLSTKQSSNRGARGISQQLGALGKGTGDAKPKDLIGIPWMVAFALRADGWWLRQDLIWHRATTMPESVTDRCTKAHEYIFLPSKSERYYFNNEAIKEPSECPDDDRKGRSYAHHKSAPTDERNGMRPSNYLDSGRVGYPMRNKRSVWSVTNCGYHEAHFATFPPDLIKPCILAGTKPGGTVLDPFFGSGTTGMVALELGRKCVGIELNPQYIDLAKTRCNVTPGFQF